MTLSVELQAIYSTETDADYWSGLVLSHPLVTTQYLCNTLEAQTAYVDSTLQTFAAIPFSFTLPARDAEGQQDLSLQICAIGGEVRAILDAAIEDPTTPVTCQYGEWLYGSTAQQWDPLLELALTDIAVTLEGVACTATRSDVLNRSVPRQLYTVELFPGLNRR